MRAVADALISATSGEIPSEYFEAFAETPEQGKALSALHQSRAAWERRQGDPPAGPEVDGGL